MHSRKLFTTKLLLQLHNLENVNKGLVVMLAMFKKTNPLETFLAPSHNDLIFKAESSTRNCNRWTRNSGAVGIQTIQQDENHQQRNRSHPTRGRNRGNPVSNNIMGHKRFKNQPRSNFVINPLNAWMPWNNVPQYPPTSFFMQRSLSDSMVCQQQTYSNVCFRRNASSGEFSGGNVNTASVKSREY